eukprot:5693295-Lingulodinium_polyedra.AAC.1
MCGLRTSCRAERRLYLQHGVVPGMGNLAAGSARPLSVCVAFESFDWASAVGVVILCSPNEQDQLTGVPVWGSTRVA